MHQGLAARHRFVFSIQLLDKEQAMKRATSLTCASLILILIAPTAFADEPTVGDFTAFWSPIVGFWKMTNEVFGETNTGIFRFRIAPNKKCALLYHGSDKEPYTQQLQGYDPVAKKLFAFGFQDTGNFQIQTISIDGMTKGKKAAKGEGGSWELKVFGTDGKTITSTSKWSFTHLDDEKVVIVWKDIVDDGQPKPGEIRMTLERQEQ